MPPPTFASGHLLVNRYRIGELLGVGQTAEVYLAEDTSLQRTVVVKVLLPRLAGHEDVRRAFRDRIVQAATLSHPHLARVYDGGQESGSIFMICEYLSGGSLEQVLASGRTLSVDDGARLGRDVASALAYVHESGMVHGALSPSKLLLDDEGRVRVSDVALAGIGSAYRERLTLNDVRFLSPEQAIGDPAGPKSDVYALALIIYEALTGVTPFDGVTPESVLRARINATLPMRPELGTLDMLLAQAAVPDPRLRLDADTFANRLGAVVSDDLPLVIAPVQGEVPLLSQYRPSAPRNSVGFRPPSPDQITGATPVVAPLGARSAPRHARPADEWMTPATGSLGARRSVRPEFDDSDYSRLPGSRRLAFLIAAVLLLVLAVGGGLAWIFGAFTSSNAVPNLANVNLSQFESSTVTHYPNDAALKAKLLTDGFTIAITKTYSATVAKGVIIAQTPVAGTVEKSGQVITVSVSNGVHVVNLPKNLVGEECTVAEARLHSIHVNASCPASKLVSSSVTPLGKVAQVVNSAGHVVTSVPVDSTVILERSSGPAVTSTTTTTSTLPNTATTTTTIPLAEQVAVPNVVGMDQAQVLAAFKKADLYYTTTGPGAGTKPTWTSVVSESPGAGTTVKKLSEVILTVK
jgi:eukaryotic-like serine/threonine-protein kinase